MKSTSPSQRTQKVLEELRLLVEEESEVSDLLYALNKDYLHPDDRIAWSTINSYCKPDHSGSINSEVCLAIGEMILDIKKNKTNNKKPK